MGKRGSSGGRRYVDGRVRSRGSAPQPHETTEFDWVCYPKDELDPSIQYPELDTDVGN
jgi:hypothetical protein